MKNAVALLTVLFLSPTLFAQTTARLRQEADSLYMVRQFHAAATVYVRLGEAETFALRKRDAFYNAACCFALVNQRPDAFSLLRRAIAAGYKDADHLVHDHDLDSLHGDHEWKDIVRPLEEWEKSLSDPSRAQIVTTDIHNFWAAYDSVKRDTAHARDIYENIYFARATPGLQDYMALRIGSVDNFVANLRSKPRFYAAIRGNTLKIDSMKDDIRRSFFKLKELYDDARFPNVYFVIGRWNSAGTTSDNGMLVGADMLSKSDDIPEDELNLWQKNNYKSIADLPNLVAHELIHIQQGRLKRDTTLLSAALTEGMADFLGELISGKTANERLKTFAVGKEKSIWQEFKKEMLLNRASNWIGNAQQETPDHPADLGYYVGYQICRSFYETMKDKRAAVREILDIQNYPEFLRRSGYDQRMSGR